MATRFDSVPIRDAQFDEQTGYLNVKRVPIARVMVQPYRLADGSIEMEAKLPNQLLSEATVASANMKPVTDGHPDGLVTKNNSQELLKGMTASNAHIEGNMLYNDITITDAALIDKVRNNGKRELSIGFETEIVPQSGELNGVHYDSVQKNIKINHVAVVERGRAGHEVRLLGDAAIAVEENKGASMETTKVRLGDSDINVAVSDAEKVTKLDAENSEKSKRIDSLKGQIKELQAKLEEEEGKTKSAQDKADAALKENDTLKSKYEGDSFDEKVQKAMEARMDLIDTVRPYLGDSYDFKGKDEKALKVDAIKEKRGVDLSDKPLSFINGYFGSLEDSADKPVVAGIGSGSSEVANDSEDELARIRAERLNMFDQGGK